MASRFLAAVIGALLLLLPAQAADKVPPPMLQEVLIKTSLLTLNDANLTGEYTVLHARLAKPFREQFNADRLKALFKVFADQNVDWGLIAAKQPVATAEATIDKRGALILRGCFDTTPSRMTYELDFLPSEGEWKPIKLNVKLKPPNEG